MSVFESEHNLLQEREDFLEIWSKNLSTVILRRREETEAGNYGFVGSSPAITETEIQLNIQGISSNFADRKTIGLDRSGSVLHAYALHDQDIRLTDEIIFLGVRFYIKQFNESFDNGQFVFKEFDMISTDDDQT